MFYFIHQIKLETIPYVEKEVQSFINYFQQHFNKIHDHNGSIRQNNQQWNKVTQKLMKIMQKKYQQIQLFYYNNWMDYRASLILRSKKIIQDFYLNNKNIFSQQTLQNLESPFVQANQESPQKFNQNPHLISVFNISSQQKQAQKDQILNSKIKQSVKRIKTQMNSHSIKQKSKTVKISIKQNKKQAKHIHNVSKDQIIKEVNKIKETNKIVEKQKNNSKIQNNSLVFTSRRKQESKKQKKVKEKITQKFFIEEKVEKIISKNEKTKLKSVSKSKSKNKLISNKNLTQRVNQEKKDEIILKNSIQKVKQSSNKVKQKTKQVPIKVKIGNKKMTKQQYVEYLVNKNKQQNKKGF